MTECHDSVYKKRTLINFDDILPNNSASTNVQVSSNVSPKTHFR